MSYFRDFHTEEYRRALASLEASARSIQTQREASGFLQEIVTFVALALKMDYAEIWERLPGEDALQIRAEVGRNEQWSDGETVSTREGSQAAYVLRSTRPVPVDNYYTEDRFVIPMLLRKQDIISDISTVIPGSPDGILAVHTTHHHIFTEEEAAFLQAVAQIAAIALGREQTDSPDDRKRLFSAA